MILKGAAPMLKAKQVYRGEAIHRKTKYKHLFKNENKTKSKKRRFHFSSPVFCHRLLLEKTLAHEDEGRCNL